MNMTFSDTITRSRRLAPFPQDTAQVGDLGFDDWVQVLLRSPSQYGYLVHGGPGSGKTELLEELARQLHERPGATAVGPINLGRYRGQSNADFILRDLVYSLLQLVEREIGRRLLPDQPLRHLSTPEVMELVDRALVALAEAGIGRVVLLLDNFDHAHAWAAVAIAAYLREIFQNHQEQFSFVLTAESDLSEIHSDAHIYSPLRNVTDLRQLLDLDQETAVLYARQLAAAAGVILSEDDLDALVYETGGYPALIASLVPLLAHGRGPGERPDYDIEAAIEELARSYYRFEPLRTVVREIENMTLAGGAINPAQTLRGLVDANQLTGELNQSARMLLAMGILGWEGAQRLTWRNPIIARFWRSSRGQKLLGQWLKRPYPYDDAQLSAQGSIYVSLLSDLGELLADPDAFNARRGSRAWVEALHDMRDNFPDDGAFRPWAEQKELTNLGHDLNLFRSQIIQNSFTPIYEANTIDLTLEFDRRLRDLLSGVTEEQLSNVKAGLHHEWGHWNRVRVQFTRDGIVIVTLIRDIDDSRPLMAVLDDLLNLERELPDERRYELSVQWELALAVVEQFVAQAGPALDRLALNVRRPTVQPDKLLYPNRDRYVIYQIRKLCNCRLGTGVRPSTERRIVTVNDLEPLVGQNGRGDRQGWQEAYNFGRELTALLEGVMVAGGQADMGQFPPLKSRSIVSLLAQDLSSWDNELFLASLDNALIVYNATARLSDAMQNPGSRSPGNSPTTGSRGSDAHLYCRTCEEYQRQTINHLYFPRRRVPYEDYWQCVTMGLQYLLELRWTAQWVAGRTTGGLARMADLMSEPLDSRDQHAILELSARDALNTRLLSHLREATIPLSIAAADYAVNKYEAFIRQSHLREVIANGEKDIHAINEFLRHHEVQVEQQEASEREQRELERSRRINNSVSVAGGILAVTAMLVTLPSLWIDFEESVIGEWLFPKPYGPPDLSHPWLRPILIGLTVIIITLVSVLAWRLRRQLRDLSQSSIEKPDRPDEAASGP